ncbi:MAG: hypothetical protein KME19_16025 [Microcoleus vaginatus WJT46-NPBG5]|nr:hypothetical protein [Microcoleus vaginatus WJT46-NPBG5]
MLNSFSRPQAKRTQALGFVAKSIFATVTASCTLGAVGIAVTTGQPAHKFRSISQLPATTDCALETVGTKVTAPQPAHKFRPMTVELSATADCAEAVGTKVTAPQSVHKFHPTDELPSSDTFTGTESQLLADGVYLFGEDPKPEQVGKAYMVFEVRRGRLIGAFYMPSSSFDCVFGSAQSQRLDVTIVNSYERTTYPYSVPLRNLHPIDSFSANDRRILSTCTETYQQQVWNQ